MEESLGGSSDEVNYSLTEDEATTLANELTIKLKNGDRPEGNQEQIKQLIAGLADKRGLLRRTFSESLGLIGKKATPELRHALLNSQNVTVRRAAAKTLKLVGDPDALPDLLKALLTDADLVVQGSSAGAIAIFGEKGVQYLLPVLENPLSTSIQCGLAKWGLAFIGAEGAKSLKKAAKSKQSIVRASAIAALGDQIQSLNDDEAKSLVINALNDCSNEVQIEAINLIGILQEYDWDTRLITTKLDSDDIEIRKQAALALMKLNAKDQIESLKERLDIESNLNVISIINLTIKMLTD
ncbi:HEAT repeat domain-containing protein [Prochlorococcus marinus]|uniref:HEAT repeat domain-containing protein n=1 Tax=Prochlorococcus marinus TaxID=1219 RepID=UPI00006728AA|nr:HEAT repeat domain-containing protein [Prochlorococcus marinus]